MSPRRYTARTTRPQAVKPAVRPGGGQAGCEIARLRGLQHKQTSPERRVQHTLEAALEMRPSNVSSGNAASLRALSARCLSMPIEERVGTAESCGSICDPRDFLSQPPFASPPPFSLGRAFWAAINSPRRRVGLARSQGAVMSQRRTARQRAHRPLVCRSRADAGDGLPGSTIGGPGAFATQPRSSERHPEASPERRPAAGGFVKRERQRCRANGATNCNTNGQPAARTAGGRGA